MARFLTAVAVTLLGLVIFFVLVRRPKQDRPPTWAESMLGAMGVFAMFILGYGIVPHEWLTWADGPLDLREDRIIWSTYPIDISGRAVRDIVATTIYIVFLGLNLVMWAMWQKRGQAKPKAAVAKAAAPAGTSAFSRPVTKRD